jgi:hypothetical protein
MEQLALYLESKGYSLLHHNHFSQEYNVIDSLCYLYAVLGFHSLFPFKTIQNIKKRKSMTWAGVSDRVIGLCLAAVLTVVAFVVSNIFSIARSGSTTTMILRKTNDFSRDSQVKVEKGF